MAKPKIEVIVNIANTGTLSVYCSDKDLATREIKQIEGVSFVVNSNAAIYVYIDIRYDINGLRQEIYDLLTAKIPAVFKEE